MLDRGFLKLKIGQTPGALADFNRALALEPDKAIALFGRDLLSAMRGDQAASKRDRSKALSLELGVANWIENTYNFGIDEAYKR